MKKIILMFLVICILASITISAGAVDIYSTNRETQPLKTTLATTPFNSGVSVTAVEPSDLSTYLSTTYNGYSRTVAQLLATLNGYITQFFQGSGSIPNGVGGTMSGSNVSLWQLTNEGFQGVTYVLNSIEDAMGGLKDYSSILNSILTSVNNVVSGLSTVNTSVGTVNTSVNSFLSDFLDQFVLPNGSTLMNSNGSSFTASRDYDFHEIVSAGFLGTRNFLYGVLTVGEGLPYLRYNGVSATTSDGAGVDNFLRHGFLGLSYNIKGSASDNIYTSTLYDNNNTTTSANSTGLGPLLNTQLNSLGANLGKIAYMFASDEDIKLKQDSQSLLDETDSFYVDSSDSKVKVSAKDIGSLKNIGGDFLDIVDTGADVSDVVTIVTNDHSFRWFSAETAADLDSIGIAVVDNEESTYDRLHREFNEIYFPDRVGGGK